MCRRCVRHPSRRGRSHPVLQGDHPPRREPACRPIGDPAVTTPVTLRPCRKAGSAASPAASIPPRLCPLSRIGSTGLPARRALGSQHGAMDPDGGDRRAGLDGADIGRDVEGVRASAGSSTFVPEIAHDQACTFRRAGHPVIRTKSPSSTAMSSATGRPTSSARVTSARALSMPTNWCGPRRRPPRSRGDKGFRPCVRNAPVRPDGQCIGHPSSTVTPSAVHEGPASARVRAGVPRRRPGRTAVSTWRRSALPAPGSTP